MFTKLRSESSRFLNRILAGLMIAVTMVAGSLGHALNHAHAYF